MGSVNWRQGRLDMLLESMDLCEHDRTFFMNIRFGNNCEWCGRIRVAKKCECEMDREARMIARRFR